MPDILIVGGGLAGIAAAAEAAREGWTVTLVEGHPYLGGRARSFMDRTTNEVIDNGQHAMMGCYHAMLGTLRILGTDHLIHRQPALKVAFADAAGRTDMLDASKAPGKFGVALGIWRLKPLPLRSRIAALWFAARMQYGGIRTDGMTCLDLLRAEGQPYDVIHRLWEPIILATLNAPMDKAAASLLLTVLRRAFFGDAENSCLYLPSAGLSAFVEPLEDLLTAGGGRVLTSTSVEACTTSDGRIADALLTTGEVIVVDRIVFAVPARSLHRITVDGNTFPLGSVPEPSPIVSVYLWYDQQWLEHDFVATLDTTIQWVFNRRLLTKADPNVVTSYPGHVAVTVSAGSELAGRSSEEIVTVCDQELRSLFPSARNAVLLHGVVLKERMATFLATPEVEPLRPSAALPWPNAALAGDWTATGLPATMEGACQSGVDAVRLLA